jgi:hypothetical protein
MRPPDFRQTSGFEQAKRFTALHSLAALTPNAAPFTMKDVVNDEAASDHHIFLLPPRSMVGQLTLDQHIGVRIPGGQPMNTRVLRYPPPTNSFYVRTMSVPSIGH